MNHHFRRESGTLIRSDFLLKMLTKRESISNEIWCLGIRQTYCLVGNTRNITGGQNTPICVICFAVYVYVRMFAKTVTRKLPSKSYGTENISQIRVSGAPQFTGKSEAHIRT